MKKTLIQNKLEMYLAVLTNSIDKVYDLNNRIEICSADMEKLKSIAKPSQKELDKLSYAFYRIDDLELQIELEEVKQDKIKSLILNIEKYV
tara:strand:- start:2405 stop:2677 length:273 start_codon:yes stop_codon:yes gene_type:complete